jgi:hypothetical protein
VNSRVTGGLLAVAVLLAAIGGAVEPVTADAATAASCHPALRAISVTPGSVPGGAPAEATAVLTCATAKPLAVTLRGSSGITTPKSVAVPAGKTSGSAAVRTATGKKTIRREVTATLAGARKMATLTITPTPKTCANPALQQVSLPALAFVGNHPALVVRLSCAAAAATRISLKSGDGFLPVPAAVTVGKYYAIATVPLTPRAHEEGQFKATITATRGKTVIGKTITVDPGVSEVAIDPSIGYPDQIELTVLTTGIVPAGGLTVKLSSSSPDVTVPAIFAVPAGALGSMVPGVVVNPVSKNTKVTISATLAGVTESASYVLVPPWNNRDSLTIGPESGPGPLYGLENYVGYDVSLSDPAPAGGLTADVSLGTSVLQLFAPPPITFAPGQETDYFEVNVSNLTAPVHTTMTVTVDGVTAKTPVTIEPGLASFTLPATLSTGTTGAAGTGTITLAGPVDAATTVDLQSTWGILTVPLSVTVPAGKSSATFPISVLPVTSDSPVSIVASLGTSTLQSGNIDVAP